MGTNPSPQKRPNETYIEDLSIVVFVCCCSDHTLLCWFAERTTRKTRGVTYLLKQEGLCGRQLHPGTLPKAIQTQNYVCMCIYISMDMHISIILRLMDRPCSVLLWSFRLCQSSLLFLLLLSVLLDACIGDSQSHLNLTQQKKYWLKGPFLVAHRLVGRLCLSEYTVLWWTTWEHMLRNMLQSFSSRDFAA